MTPAADPGAILVRVAVPIPIRRTLTYRVEPPLAERARPGARVVVRVGGRRMAGIVVGAEPPGTEAIPGIRSVEAIPDDEPLLTEELLAFTLRAADYYLAPPGEALRTALPPKVAAAETDGKPLRGRVGRQLVLHARLRSPLPEDPASALRRAPARARIVDFLAKRGEASIEELRRTEPRASQLLRALEQGGWVVIERREPDPDPLLDDGVGRDRPPELTAEQRDAVGRLVDAIRAGGYRGFLLHGVTGSGKTEVYLHAIEAALAQGRTAVVLVPEIALTPQLVSRFRARLGRVVAVLHSGLSERERLREWLRLHGGQARVAIGARSAVFAPVRDLGVVVVDEEHDPSFKQDEGFRYNGRDLALLRARRADAIAILGSATPSLESYYNAERGRLELISLPKRVTPRPLPQVEIVDLTRHRSGPGGQNVVTEPLAQALKRALEAGEQAIVFINRRGYAPFAICGSCGEALRCLGCSVALTYHRRSAMLECHYCAFSRTLPQACPTCGAEALRLLGTGTERAEETLRELLGQTVRVGRLDSDVAPGRASEAVLQQVRSGETDVLVGTQMVTKGHDLPGVTVVGVLLADASLHLPDFRAQERTFQLLTQVAGRAGRGEALGRVLIQTFDPTHPAVRLAGTHDYAAFFEAEMRARRELGYPPFSHMASIRLSSPIEERVRREAERVAAAARRLPEAASGEVVVLGPAPAPLAMIRSRYRYRVLLRSRARTRLRRVLVGLTEVVDSIRSGVRAGFDVDPVHLL